MEGVAGRIHIRKPNSGGSSSNYRLVCVWVGLLMFILASYALENVLPGPSALIISVLFGVLSASVINSIINDRSGKFAISGTDGMPQGEIIEDVILFRQGSKVIAVGGLELERIPIGVRGNFEFFIRSAYAERIPLVYVFIQEPLSPEEALREPELSDEYKEKLKRKMSEARESLLTSIGGVWRCRMLLLTRYETGNSEKGLVECAERVRERVSKIKSLFLSGFPHTKLRVLRGEELREAVLCVVRGVEGGS